MGDIDEAEQRLDALLEDLLPSGDQAEPHPLMVAIRDLIDMKVSIAISRFDDRINQRGDWSPDY